MTTTADACINSNDPSLPAPKASAACDAAWERINQCLGCDHPLREHDAHGCLADCVESCACRTPVDAATRAAFDAVYTDALSGAAALRVLREALDSDTARANAAAALDSLFGRSQTMLSDADIVEAVCRELSYDVRVRLNNPEG